MKAFVLRIAPSGQDRIKEAITDEELIIGWSEAKGLLNDSLEWVQFRQTIHDAYYAEDSTFRGSGAAAGNMWRFIRDMEPGDLVAVPHGDSFFVARVTGPATYRPELVSSDTAYRRPVEWLNKTKPIPRSYAKSRLQSRLKARQTCANATDLIDHLQEVVDLATSGEVPTFGADLRRHLIESALGQLRDGRMNERHFEELIADVLRAVGGQNVRVVAARQLDVGADVIADFTMADSFSFKLAVQAKYFRPEPPIDSGPVEQLIQGMHAEDATVGWVVTSGTFSAMAEKKRVELEEDTGFRIELIDGEQLAALIVENGLRSVIGDSE